MNKLKTSVSLFAMILCASMTLWAQAPDLTGQWQTQDDETGRIKSVVEISVEDGILTGRLVELFRLPEEDQDPYCDECEDDRKDQRVLGMQIVRGMQPDDGEWDSGTICDPKNGRVYNCKMWISEEDPDVMKVRGYIAFFFRTQSWFRVK
jgi:uncharacterized protein (DUF2147 family)